MIMSSDRDFTLWPKAGTELTVDVSQSSIVLPVVGGESALRKAITVE
jgi:X-Pro dipeptidyl-peptidase